MVLRKSHVFPALLLLLSSCGQANREVEARKPSDAEVFVWEQDAIADCMRLQGFEYTPEQPPSLERDHEFVDQITMPTAETLGFTGVFEAALNRKAPASWGTMSKLSTQQLIAFESALWREDDSSHDHDSAQNHHHTDTTDHDHSPGCALQARQASRTEFGQSSPRPEAVDMREYADLLERIRASGQFDAYAADWRACMAGREPLAADPFEQQGLAFDRYFTSATTLIFAFEGADESGTLPAWPRDENSPKIPPIDDMADFEHALDLVPGLRDLFDAEVAEASVDAACRRAGSETVTGAIEPFAQEYDWARFESE